MFCAGVGSARRPRQMGERQFQTICEGDGSREVKNELSWRVSNHLSYFGSRWSLGGWGTPGQGLHRGRSRLGVNDAFLCLGG